MRGRGKGRGLGMGRGWEGLGKVWMSGWFT